jgi:ABC-2 type transport system ATP-binding protein
LRVHVTAEDDDTPGSPPGAKAVLEVEGARRSFAGRVALDGVNLALAAGEIYGLLGPNGAGKTTLVRAICGRVRLDAGQVRLLGRDPVCEPRARRGLGLVPQELALYSDLSARENLQIFARLMGLGGRESQAAADRLLDRIGLAERAGDPVATLSGGMRRRLNVAAGVIHRPRVLLLDEPTVGVDPTARESIHDLLRDLRRDGLAILLTTHDLEQAAELADRVGMIIDGRIRAQGPVPELIRDVFGDSRELLVTLDTAPGQRGRAQLTDRGLASSRNERVWTGRLQRGFEDLSALAAGLESAGLAVNEVRIREPGLRGVFFRLAGREIDA